MSPEPVQQDRLSCCPGVTVALVLLVIALILLVLAGFGVGAGRVHFGWLGLAVVVAVLAVWPAAH